MLLIALDNDHVTCNIENISLIAVKAGFTIVKFDRDFK